MKKLLIIVSILFIFFVSFFIVLYNNAIGPVKKAEQKALIISKEKTSLVFVEDFSIFNGSQSYYVLKGKNKQNEKVIVWISEDDKNQVVIKKENDGISKQDAINKLKEEITPKEIISVRLGMEKNIPLWEIYYRTEGNLMNYYYVDFETGEWLKRIENL